jgi:hypothetical protein
VTASARGATFVAGRRPEKDLQERTGGQSHGEPSDDVRRQVSSDVNARKSDSGLMALTADVALRRYLP